MAHGTARPQADTASVAFLMATDDTGQDQVTKDIMKYVTDLVKAAKHTRGRMRAPALPIKHTGSKFVPIQDTPLHMAKQVKELDKLRRTGKLPKKQDPRVNETFDKHLGYLRGNNLLIFCHGTRADLQGNYRQSIHYKRRHRGLLLRNYKKGPHDKDVLLLVRHLENMKTVPVQGGGPEKKNVVPDKKKLNALVQTPKILLSDDEIKRTRAEVPDLAKLMDAIRNTKFSRVYLCACGDPPQGFTAPKNRFDRFAKLWFLLTDQTVYYNSFPLFVSSKYTYPTNNPSNRTYNYWIRAGGAGTVGASGVYGTPYWYYKKPQVELKTNDSPPANFLEGSTDRYPGYI
jgi:hypothetical protein